MSERRGFTMVELMAALVITGLVALLAHRTFAVAVDGARRLHRARVELDRGRNANRWLSATFLSLEIGQHGSTSFEGAHAHARFSTWLPASGGWLERTTVNLALEGSSLVASVGDTGRMVLADGVRALTFDYLLEPGANTRWAAEWVSPVNAPIAVRLRLNIGAHTDTLLYLIKARG